MISEKDLAELENIPYEQRIERVEKLLEGKSEPRAFELGLLLALKMGQEIREGKELGSESGDLVASWNGRFPESIVEEAIAFAKEFLMNPAKLAEKIKSGMLKTDEKECHSERNEVESLAPNYNQDPALAPRGKVLNSDGEAANG